MDHDEAASPRPQRSLPRRLLNRLEVDRAVFYAIVSRGWQFIAGPITAIMIMHFFSKEVQGYYYMFWSMVGLQMFFELGFTQAIINIASHEWDKLTLHPDRSIGGDTVALSRLTALFRSAMFCYVGMACVLWLVVTCAGWIFFSADEDSDFVDWRAPWLTMSALTAVAFGLTPMLTILEGCNQVKSVYKLQLTRAVLGNCAVWICLPLGGALWTPVIATVVRLVCEGYVLFVQYGQFFRTFRHKPVGNPLNWWTEVWPFQWRLATKGLFGYFNALLMQPVVFYYFGSVAAGQLGMTWQVLSSLQAACASWLQTRVARLGMLVARRDFGELDRVFFRVTGIALVVMCLASVGFWMLDAVLYAIDSPFAARLLGPLPTGVLALGLLASLVTYSQWTYIHAHQRSPYLLLTISAATLSGLLIWWWGAWYGALGVVSAYFAVNALLGLPVWTIIWLRCRKEWHSA